MKTNKFISTMLATMLTFSLSLGFSACSDDDDKKSEEEKQQEQQDEQNEAAQAFWSVVGQLCSMSDATGDYASKTFEPTIGTEGSDAQTRVVYKNSAAAAAESFGYLVNVDDITEETASYEWSDPAVGTLTYRKVTDGTAWATVDVNIRQVPHLTTLIYRSPEQGDQNGSVKNGGRAYYRFGDVVSRKNAEGELEYWVCVRPAFDPEGKGETHWASVSPVPKANRWTYTSSHKNTYVLPTMLGTNKEHMQNLAEMLYAICFPQKWYKNVQDNASENFFGFPKGMKIFHDFHASNVNLHNQHFWQNVQNAWKRKELDIFHKLFGYDAAVMSDQIENNGLYLLYNGYTWKTWVSNSLTLYQAHFVNGEGEHANMQTASPYSTVTKQVVNKENENDDIVINIERDYTLDSPYLELTKFFSDNSMRYIVRIATGAELSSTGKYDNNQFQISGVTDVYRYYRDVVDCKNLDQAPEETTEGDVVPDDDFAYENRAYYMPGDVVRDKNAINWFCVQSSAHGNAALEASQPYTYFISFDKNALGTKFENVPASKSLAAQILFNLEVYMHGYTGNVGTEGNMNNYYAKSMSEYFGATLGDLVAVRDTLHKFTKDNAASTLHCNFISTLYQENGTLYVLRLVGDYTAEQDNGVREFAWRFYDSYTQDLSQKMALNDLGRISKIEAYREDRWVSLPWYDIYTQKESKANTGVRTQTMMVSDLNELVYKQGRTAIDGDAVTNMYREPLIPFAVKRIKDTGKRILQFEDGTAFTELHRMVAYNPWYSQDIGAFTMITNNTYSGYSGRRIYLNDKNWQFGMGN